MDERGYQINPDTPHLQDVTIMFVDVVGFSLTAEDREPGQLFKHLRASLAAMTQTIHDHGGIVDKMLGDGFLVVFGYRPSADDPAIDHVNQAVNCAIDIQRQAARTCAAAAEQNNPLFPTRIGLNTDKVFVGNFGSDQSPDVTVVGHGVNFAKRIEDSCDKFMVMMSDVTRERLKSTIKGSALVKRQITVKHHDRLFDVYELNPFIDDVAVLNDALRAYQKYQGMFREDRRFFLRENSPLKCTSDYGDCKILDYSKMGMRVELNDYLARGVHLRLSLSVEGGSRKAKYLELIGLTSLHCVVQWGRNVNGRHFHGLRTINLSEEQRQIVFNLLDEYKEKEVD